MMDNNEYMLFGFLGNLVSAALSTAVGAMFALLSLTSVYRAPRIVRVELSAADSTFKPL